MSCVSLYSAIALLWSRRATSLPPAENSRSVPTQDPASRSPSHWLALAANRTLMLSTVSWRNDAGANSPRRMPHQRVLPLSPDSHSPKNELVPSRPYWLAPVLL